MSVVWRAHDEVLDRQVAVKVLAAPRVDAAARARILLEAQAAARLTHPHITSVHDYGETRDGGDLVPYVVMELVRGPTLAERLKAGRLPVRTAVLIGAQVASALAAAHARGLVHRDVKPSNVILSPAGAKVVDFGLAAVAGDTAESGEQVIWGTPAYLAPERLTNGEVVPASDVYALGVLLYRMLTGGPPWKADTVTQILRAHESAEPAPLPVLEGLPESVADICLRCLAKQPHGTAGRGRGCDSPERCARCRRGGRRVGNARCGHRTGYSRRATRPAGPRGRRPTRRSGPNGGGGYPSYSGRPWWRWR